MAQTVLVVAHGHPELSVGGGEIVAHQLFRGLQQTLDVEAWFIAADDPTRPPSAGLSSHFAGRPNEILLHSRAADPFWFTQRSSDAIDHFVALVRKIDPDIVHFHHYMNLGLELIAGVRRAVPNARIVLTLHEYLGICANYGQMVKTGSLTLCHRAGPDDCTRCFPKVPPTSFSLRQQFIRHHFDLVDAFVAPSAFLRQRYIEWGLPAERITVLDNPTATTSAPPPRALKLGERRSVFGFFGQINPYKGLPQLLSAFALLGRRPIAETGDIRLRVHGSYLELNPPEFVATVQDLLSRTAPRTEFSGPYDRDQLRELMAAVDWVIVPSIWWENAPLIIEEALAHQRPVICSDIGGMSEKIRPGKDGLHFPVGDVPALANLLEEVSADRTVWDELRRRMRTPITIRQSVAEHLSLYCSLSARRQSRPAAPFGSSAKQGSSSLGHPKIGTARIVALAGGIHLLGLRPGAAGQIEAIHICAAPGEAAGVLAPLGGTAAIDIWLGPEGGMLLVKPRGGGCRLIVTEYAVPGSKPGMTMRITIRQLAAAEIETLDGKAEFRR